MTVLGVACGTAVKHARVCYARLVERYRCHGVAVESKGAVEFVQVEGILFLRSKCYLLLCMLGQQCVILFNSSVFAVWCLHFLN